MARVEISGDNLLIQIDDQGAELKRLYRKDNGIEYLWPGDNQYWGRSSPVLFPVVGRLRDDYYQYKNKKYLLPQHGFARDKAFQIVQKTKDSISLKLNADHDTTLKYPWSFELLTSYVIDGNTLKVEHTVTNDSEEAMYYSIGAHPAFRWPLRADIKKENYMLEFPDDAVLTRLLLQDGLISDHELRIESFNDHKLYLDQDLFTNDALVFRKLISSQVILRTAEDDHGVNMEFHNAPYFGVWTKPGADFICLEPWNGVADYVHSNHLLEKKEGINLLGPGKSSSMSWGVTLY